MRADKINCWLLWIHMRIINTTKISRKTNTKSLKICRKIDILLNGDIWTDYTTHKPVIVSSIAQNIELRFEYFSIPLIIDEKRTSLFISVFSKWFMNRHIKSRGMSRFVSISYSQNECHNIRRGREAETIFPSLAYLYITDITKINLFQNVKDWMWFHLFCRSEKSYGLSFPFW